MIRTGKVPESFSKTGTDSSSDTTGPSEIPTESHATQINTYNRREKKNPINRPVDGDFGPSSSLDILYNSIERMLATSTRAGETWACEVGKPPLQNGGKVDENRAAAGNRNIESDGPGGQRRGRFLVWPAS